MAKHLLNEYLTEELENSLGRMEYKIGKNTYYWVECSDCREKSGSPVLCQSCLHNRDTFMKLMDIAKGKIVW
jgi:hypothetical protein